MISLVVVFKAPITWFRRLYDWTIHWSRTKRAPQALFAIAFVESSCFPIPPDALLIPMVVGHRQSWVRFASICTIGSVLGALLGYFIGWGLYETIGKPIVEIYHLQSAVEMLGQKYIDNAFLVIFTAAFTPIPFKAITISAGLFNVPIPTLIFASLIGRAGRFFLISACLRLFGKKIKDSIEKYFDIFSIIFIVLLIGGFIALKFIFK